MKVVLRSAVCLACGLLVMRIDLAAGVPAGLPKNAYCSGVYPHLAVTNGGDNESGIGAIMLGGQALVYHLSGPRLSRRQRQTLRSGRRTEPTCGPRAWAAHMPTA